MRVVNDAVNRLSDFIFNTAYPGGGHHSYHPKILTKIIIYANNQRIYSSPANPKAVRENIVLLLYTWETAHGQDTNIGRESVWSVNYFFCRLTSNHLFVWKAVTLTGGLDPMFIFLCRGSN
uniref:hypothetical protein n=1 Tax=Paenibacillus taichungensis TaxID=484184 RepID=UPI001586A4BF|nr:hypothetical protein [Paenibacillus taichungensis]